MANAKCGNCLMERVEVVDLLPDGTCPDCGQNYEKGIPPRHVHRPDATGRICTLCMKKLPKGRKAVR